MSLEIVKEIISLPEEYNTVNRLLYFGDERVDIEGNVVRFANEKKIPDDLETVDCIDCEHSPPKCDVFSVLETVRQHDSNLRFSFFRPTRK